MPIPSLLPPPEGPPSTPTPGESAERDGSAAAAADVLFGLGILTLLLGSALGPFAGQLDLRPALLGACEPALLLIGVAAGRRAGDVHRRSGTGEAAGWLLDQAVWLGCVHFGVVGILVTLGALAGQGAAAPIANQLLDVALLRGGTADTALLGLATALFLGAPAAIWLLAQRRTPLLLLGSGLGWLAYQAEPVAATSAAFEAFHPLLAWQLLFVVGLTAGFHGAALVRALEGWAGRASLVAATSVLAAVALYVEGTTSGALEGWLFRYGAGERIHARILDGWFHLVHLGPGRVVHLLAVVLVAWSLLRVLPARWLAQHFAPLIALARGWVTALVALPVLALAARALVSGLTPDLSVLWRLAAWSPVTTVVGNVILVAAAAAVARLVWVARRGAPARTLPVPLA